VNVGRRLASARAVRRFAAPRAGLTGDEPAAWAFISPWLLGLVLFIGLPVVVMGAISLTDWSLVSTPRFVGLDNYASMLSDRRFGQSVGVTVRYTILSLPILLVLGLGLSILLNQPIRGIGIFRTIMFVPSVLAGVAVAVLWFQILNPEFGILNQFLRGLGVERPPRWLTSPEWAVPAVVLTSVWTVGGGAIIYLAGLQNIPAQLYEAAEIDGAGPRQRFWHITIPMLSPTLFFGFITTLIGSFQVFDVAFVLGGSRGSSGSLLFYLLNLWNEGFRNGRMGYASALGVVFVAVAAVIIVLAIRASERFVYYETKGE
jgi:multiple sugar transport system permease protein